MPAIATHYKFGQLVLDKSNADLKEIILKNKELFDLGTQGPDVLFYHNPLKRTDIVSLGVDIHLKSGSDFFQRTLNLSHTPKDLAYIFGCICHYSLDVSCHPLIIKASNKTDILHRKIESYLDLVVIEKYNMTKKRHLFLPSNIDFNVIAKIYNISLLDAKKSVKRQRVCNNLLNHSKFIGAMDNILSKDGLFSSLSLLSEPAFDNDISLILNEFDKSIDSAILRMNIYYNSIKNNCPLDGDFVKNFEGEE